MSPAGTHWWGAGGAGVAVVRTMMMMRGDLRWCRRLRGCRGCGVGCCHRAAVGKNKGRVHPTAKNRPQSVCGDVSPPGTGDPDPSPAPGHTPPLTAARQAGRRRQRPGLCSAAPGDTAALSASGTPTCPPLCDLGVPVPAYPARPGSAAAAAALGDVFGAGGLAGGEVDAEMGPPVERLPGRGTRTKPPVASRCRRGHGDPSASPRPVPTVLATPSTLSSRSSCPWVSSTERARSRGAGSAGDTAVAPVTSSTAPSTSAMGRPVSPRDIGSWLRNS